MARSGVSDLFTIFAVLFMLTSSVLGHEIFIKPHPSLPSLESLGITPAQLYDMALNMTTDVEESPTESRGILPREGRHRRSAAYTDHCDGNLCAPAGWIEAQACAVFLRTVGDVPFTADKTFQVLCEAHATDGSNRPRALVMAYAIITNARVQDTPRATAAARDIAEGALWVVNRCDHYGCNSRGLCGISGTAAARGNGDFLVYIASEIMPQGACPR